MGFIYPPGISQSISQALPLAGRDKLHVASQLTSPLVKGQKLIHFTGFPLSFQVYGERSVWLIAWALSAGPGGGKATEMAEVPNKIKFKKHGRN